MAMEVADIARRLQQAHSVKQISEITGLEPGAVKMAVMQSGSPEHYAKARKEAMAELSATHPEFNQVLYQLLGSFSRCNM